MILQQIGSMPPELVRKNTELFAREVMPHMRGSVERIRGQVVAEADCRRARWRCRRPTGHAPSRPMARRQRRGRRPKAGARSNETHQRTRDGKFSVEMEVTGKRRAVAVPSRCGRPVRNRSVPRRPRPQLQGISHRICRAIGESTGGEHIDDVIDAALFYHQLMDELNIDSAPRRRPLDGRDARGGSRGARHASGEEARAGRGGRLLARRKSDSGFVRARSDDLPAYLFHDPKSPFAQMMLAIPRDDQELLTRGYVRRARQAFLDGERSSCGRFPIAG